MSSGATTYGINVSEQAAVAGDRDSIGGWPLLDATQPWPVCGCGVQMALYFQVAVPADVPHFGGDQLLVFQCPDESDASIAAEGQLPPEFWEKPPLNKLAFWRILLQRNGLPAHGEDPYLQPRRLILTGYTGDNQSLPSFAVGGDPSWVQGPRYYRCACGEDLVFLCEVPEDFEFYEYVKESVERTALDDGLMLGNSVYILACPAHCHPAAAFPVCQN
ncbi:hypothetical protein [Nocardia salmonicida]|uniref:hypothetical protein n=1 Tax=Nocardia salmonicida TaxID=53431 RepID=UPI0007A52A01|nr:hypothetical protein [Nocardia salmonicida]